MTLVAVGTQHFDALVSAVDDLVQRGVLTAPVWGQIGSGKYLPQHFEYVRYEPNLAQRVSSSDLIITHAGTGLVIECIRSGRPFVAVPDPLKADNHQLEFLEALAERYDFCWVHSPAELEAALPQARPARAKDGASTDTLAADILGLIGVGEGGQGNERMRG